MLSGAQLCVAGTLSHSAGMLPVAFAYHELSILMGQIVVSLCKICSDIAVNVNQSKAESLSHSCLATSVHHPCGTAMLPFVRLPKESSTTTKAAEAAETTTQTGASSGAGMFSIFKKPQQVVEAIVPVPGTAAGAGGRSRKLLPGRPMPHIMLSTVQVRHSPVAWPCCRPGCHPVPGQQF